ncbi:MAG: amidohydrolase family protein, partial [Thermoanaerobaculia bacterium]
TSVTPIPLHGGEVNDGTRILVAGRGFGGDGETGPVERDRQFRAAENRVDRVLPKWLVFRFDAPPAALDLEGISGRCQPVASEPRYVVAGVSSGQNDFGKGEGRYGVDEYYARVSAYADWIAKTTRVVVVRGGTLIDGDTVIENATVIVRGDRIESVGAGVPIPAGAEIVDATRGFIVPGFIDNHVHVGRTGVSDDWVKSGVTTLVDNGSSAPTPGVPSCGRILTAPGGYPAFGSSDAPALEVSTIEEVERYLDEARPDCVKIAIERGFLADFGDEGWPTLTPALTRAIVKAAHARKLLVRAHVTQPGELAVAIEAGVDVIAHTPIAKVPPALLRKAAAQQIIFITTAALWDDEKLEKIVTDNLLAYLGAGGRIAIGTDFPNIREAGLSAELHALTSIPPAALLEALTRSGAAVVGRTDIGVLTPGARADLVILDADPRRGVAALQTVRAVVRGGEIVPISRAE